MTPTNEFEEYKYEQARQWLEAIRRLGDSVATQQALVDSEREMIDGIRGIDYSRDATSGTPSDDAMVNAIENLQRHITSYVQQLNTYVDIRQDASKRLAKMEDASEARALTLRYLLGKTWEEVCVDMHYSYDGMMKLRRRAVINAYDVMPNDKRDPLHRAI